MATLVLAPYFGDVVGYLGNLSERFLVLDRLLEQGFAGCVFRRLRVYVAMNPRMRDKFDELRHDYLRALLARRLVTSSVVVIGSHPSDVDLFDFDRVVAFRVSDVGMRVASQRVYGDAMSLGVEYASVLMVAADSIDHFHGIGQWDELVGILYRNYMHCTPVDVTVSAQVQRNLLRSAMNGWAAIDTWLEPPIEVDVAHGQGLLVMDNDYLAVVRPVWRDAVLRVLGMAPAIERLLHVPWYAVEPNAVRGLCYRTNVNGVPAASMVGTGLVSFVRSRLQGVLSAREMAGTWVGALLGEPIEAEVALVDLAGEPLVSEVARVSPEVVGDCVAVPSEMAWMYELVPDVCVREWDHAMSYDDIPPGCDVVGGWVKTLSVAKCFRSLECDPDGALAVVEFMRALHGTGLSRLFVSRLAELAARAYAGAALGVDFDIGLLSYLPGFSYLSVVPAEVQNKVYAELGAFPSLDGLSVCMANLVERAVVEARVNRLRVNSLRSSLLSGVAMRADAPVTRVGGGVTDVDGFRDGECYLALVKPRFRTDAFDRFGKFPTVQQLDAMPARWLRDVPRGFFDISVVSREFTPEGGGLSGVLLHIEERRDTLLYRPLMLPWSSARVYVGAVSTPSVLPCPVCSSNPIGWVVATVAGWTALVVLAIVFLLLMWKQKKLGGSGGRIVRR